MGSLYALLTSPWGEGFSRCCHRWSFEMWLLQWKKGIFSIFWWFIVISLNSHV